MTKTDAIKKAKTLSKSNPDTEYAVIKNWESNGYYVGLLSLTGDETKESDICSIFCNGEFLD